MLVSSLTLVMGVYTAGIVRLWRTAGYGRGVRPFEALAFAAGWLSLVIALSPPLDEWSERWLAAHMVQHELLMVVAAPLIAYGAPIIGLLWAMPARVRRVAVTSVRRTGVSRVWNALTTPGCVFVLYGAALWIWHVPALYDYAVEHEGVHIVQHLCFFGTATLFWWGITHGRQGRAGYGAAVVYVFLTAVHGAVLGALLTVSPGVWYAPYLVTRPDGLTPLEDQQLAGLLMWVPAGLAFAAGGLFLFAAWLRQSDRRSRFADAPTAELMSTRIP
jgi:cytochrome c oxidase assembly factor CtaG